MKYGEGWVGIYSKLGRQNPESVSAKSRVGFFFLTRFWRWLFDLDSLA